MSWTFLCALCFVVTSSYSLFFKSKLSTLWKLISHFLNYQHLLNFYLHFYFFKHSSFSRKLESTIIQHHVISTTHCMLFSILQVLIENSWKENLKNNQLLYMNWHCILVSKKYFISILTTCFTLSCISPSSLNPHKRVGKI